MRRWKQERRRSVREKDVVSPFVYVSGRRRLTRALQDPTSDLRTLVWEGQWFTRGRYQKRRVTRCEALGSAAYKSWFSSECSLDDAYVKRLVTEMRRTRTAPEGVPVRAVLLELSKHSSDPLEIEAAELLVDLFQQNKVSYSDMCAAIFALAHITEEKRQVLIKYLDLLPIERARFEKRIDQLETIIAFKEPLHIEPVRTGGMTLRLLLAALAIGMIVPGAQGFGWSDRPTVDSGGVALTKAANTMASLTGPPLQALAAAATLRPGAIQTPTTQIVTDVQQLVDGIKDLSRVEYKDHTKRVLSDSIARNWDPLQTPLAGISPTMQNHLAAMATIADAIASDPEWLVAYLLQLNPSASVYGFDANVAVANAKQRTIDMLASIKPEVLAAARDAGTGETAEAVLDRVMQPRYIMTAALQEQTALRKTFRTLGQPDRARVALAVAAQEAAKDNDLPRAIADTARLLNLTLDETTYVQQNIATHLTELNDPRRDIKLLLRNASYVIDLLYNTVTQSHATMGYYAYSYILPVVFMLKRFVSRRFNVQESVWESIMAVYNNAEPTQLKIPKQK